MPTLYRLGPSFLFIFASALILTQASSRTYSQVMDLAEIHEVLSANPPTTGDPTLREEAILNLDSYLKMQRIRPSLIIPFYNAQMAGLADAIAQPLAAGARIWQMYNHGFIVRTPSSVFGFDLVNPVSFPSLPVEVLRQIDVLFVSHQHGDHSDGSVRASVLSFGGEVIRWTDIPTNTEILRDGLSVVAYPGQHNVPNYIYHLTTLEGLTVMHTGDTQHSVYLPEGIPTDILLINAWMNESGSQSATIGVRNGINRVLPSLTIPGHIHELGHPYDPSSSASRVPYEWPLAVDDEPISGKLSVMAWGEVYEFGVVPEPSTLMLSLLGLSTAFVSRKLHRV